MQRLYRLRAGETHNESTDKRPGTYAIIGAAIEVHNQLGCGFQKAVNQEALAFYF